MVWVHHVKNDGLFGDDLSAMIAENERCGSIELPDLRRSDVLLGASDIADQRRTSRFVVFAFLLADRSSCGDWRRRRAYIRSRLPLGRRRIGYKELNDSLVRDAMASILDAANTINGILVSVAVHKNIPSIFTSEPVSQLRSGDHAALFDRAPKGIERLLRQFYLTGLFIGALSRANQELYWCFDSDELFANDWLRRTAIEAGGNIWSSLIPHRMGKVRLLTTQADNGDRDLEDLTALPDLAAGAVADALNEISETDMRESRCVPTTLPRSSKTKANYIASWLSNNVVPLKRIVVVILPGQDSGTLRPGLLFLHPAGEAIYLPSTEWSGSIFGGVP